MKYFIYTIIAGLVLFSAYKGKQLYDLQKEQTSLKEDFAEIHLINHGLFNIELWKGKAVSIFDKKIKDFKIDPKMYKEVNRQLRAYLNDVYKDYFASGKLVDQFIAEAEKQGKINKLFIGLIRGSAKDMVASMDIQSRIPSIADELTNEIRSNEPMIKGYLTAELDAMLFSESGNNYVDPRNTLKGKYEIEDLEALGDELRTRIKEGELKINEEIKWIYLLLLGAIFFIAITYKWTGFRPLVVGFTLISVVMLLLGIGLPMIDIDARLNAFSIDMLGSPISFDEQVLYFQSKSILDVTSTLIQSKGIDTKIVGILVFLFSIIFPFLKLILSSLFLFVDKIRNSRIAKTVIFYLGKWSMADVFVVAIFMAYIGFYGIIASQLDAIARGDGYTVETINYSQLSPGALFFTSYCILSIITSIIIDRVQNKNAVLQ